MVGVARTAYVDQTPARSGYLACANERLMTFGSGQMSTPVAELSAITRWMEEAAQIGEGYGNWSLARNRWLQCQNIGRTEVLQCRAAALPCRPQHT